MNILMETTVFRQVLGDAPMTRVLEFLIGGRELDYSLTDIARNSGIGWATLHRIWKGLEGAGIVAQTRTIGKAKLYRLDAKNQVARQLVKLYDVMLVAHTEKSLARRVEVSARRA